MHHEDWNEEAEVEEETSPEPTATTEELVFIYSMIKSVASGAWGDDNYTQAQNLIDAGFSEPQVFNLLVAVEERSKAG